MKSDDTLPTFFGNCPKCVDDKFSARFACFFLWGGGRAAQKYKISTDDTTLPTSRNCPKCGDDKFSALFACFFFGGGGRAAQKYKIIVVGKFVLNTT